MAPPKSKSPTTAPKPAPTGLKGKTVALREDVQELLKAFDITEKSFEMSAAKLASWAKRLALLKGAEAKAVAVQLIALQEQFKDAGKTASQKAVGQLNDLVVILVQRFKSTKGWKTK